MCITVNFTFCVASGTGSIDVEDISAARIEGGITGEIWRNFQKYVFPQRNRFIGIGITGKICL